MDWIDGTNLKQAIAESKKPFNLEQVSTLLQPVCGALHSEHQHGVYHCDVKPANILLHKDGRILLSDFGVAHLSQARGGGGTPPYMVPEQFAGGTVDARTDVYALGVTLYEMLSGGHVPFRGDSAGGQGSTPRERIAWEHLNLPLPSLRRVISGIPKAVEQVIATAMIKNPIQCFPSAMALHEMFEIACSSGADARTRLEHHPEKAQRLKVRLTQEPRQIGVQPVSPAALHLLCCAGEYAGQCILIPQEGLAIGRSSRNRLQLHEVAGSRDHAGMMIVPEGIYIYDQGSSLGTLVNGERIEGSQWLQHGDVIQIGYYQVFEYRER